MPSTARPATGRSRPRTSAPSNGICTLVESRGISRLVGLACFLLDSSTCILTEVADTQTFVRTVHKLNVLDPNQILMPTTAFAPAKSKLVRIVEENVSNSASRPIPRKLFSEADGLEYLAALAVPQDVAAIRTATTGKFFCIAAFAAGIKWLEQDLNTTFCPGTLRVQYQSSEGIMLMDWESINNLELISNGLEGSKGQQTLLGVLRPTSTAAGFRLLRSSILQPLTSKTILTRRLDAVQEFTEKEALFFDIQKALKEQHDLERLLAVLVTVPAQVSIKFSEQRLNDILLLKRALQAVPSLALVMSRTKALLCNEIAELLSVDATTSVLACIDDLISDDTDVASGPLALRHQRCYAVKSGINGMLDLARQTYKELVDDAVALAAQYAEYELPVQLQFDSARGFFLSLPLAELSEEAPLPDVFVNQVRRRKSLQFSTIDLAKKNTRIHEALSELLIMSDEAVEQLVTTIQQDIGALYKISEAIALLDMLHTFASAAISMRLVRPTFSEKSLGIKRGRHPVKDALEGFQYVANDTFANDNSRFQIITGCNMAGKTTYLRANAQLIVLSQVGSFVPADHMSTPTFGHLFTRFAGDDNVDIDASTFSAEMQDLAVILYEADANSVIFVDELGRGTSTADSIAITMAISERLMRSQAMTFFATHMHDLAHVLRERPGVTCLQLRVSEEDNVIKMHYQVADGTCQQVAYGLKLAYATALPHAMLDRARELRAQLSIRQTKQRASSSMGKMVKRRKAVAALSATLENTLDSQLSDDELTDWLTSMQIEFMKRVA